jgi:hypothetical protein
MFMQFAPVSPLCSAREVYHSYRSLPKFSFGRILKNRFAMSTVVTTLIVLVIAVLLASVVTYFAINVTSTRVQEESLSLMKQHVWYDNSAHVSQGAILIVNTGGRDVVIEKVTVRGQTVDWSSVFSVKGKFTLTADLSFIPGLADGSPSIVSDGFGGFQNFAVARNDLTLPSGQSTLVYVTSPDSISVGDVGITVAVNVFSSQAMYYKETNVEARVILNP